MCARAGVWGCVCATVYVCVCVCVCVRERETDRQTDRDTEIENQRVCLPVFAYPESNARQQSVNAPIA